jgi:tRNA nucleotidyltransferase/poly(A) polymerase
MLKLLVADGASAALVEMGDGGLLLDLLGGVTYHAAFDAMVAGERQLALEGEPIRRLAALAVATVEDAERVTARLRLSNAESSELVSMVHRAWQFVSLDEQQARVQLYRLGAERYLDRLMLAWAQSGGDAGRWQRLATLPARWRVPAFPLKAADFMALGLQPGPALGAALARAEQLWINAGFSSEKAELAAIANAAMGAAP